MTEIKLPDPDTHCYDDDVQPPRDVWSYSADLVRQIIEADRARRGEPVAIVFDPYDTPGLKWLCQHPPSNGAHIYTAPQPAHTEAEVQAFDEYVRHILGVTKP